VIMPSVFELRVVVAKFTADKPLTKAFLDALPFPIVEKDTHDRSGPATAGRADLAEIG
jgi:hypothetical protein